MSSVAVRNGGKVCSVCTRVPFDSLGVLNIAPMIRSCLLCDDVVVPNSLGHISPSCFVLDVNFYKGC